jgi:hypothetical protein
VKKQRGVIACKYLRDEEGKYSFQVINQATGNALFGCQSWFDSKEKAQVAWKAASVSVVESIQRAGGYILTRDDNTIEFEMDVPDTTPGGNTIVVGLLAKEDEELFGIGVFADEKMIIEPAEWFDTELKAYAYYEQNIPEYNRQLKELGLSVTLDIPPGLRDELIGLMNARQAARKQQQEVPVKKVPFDYLNMKLPEGFDPRVN